MRTQREVEQMSGRFSSVMVGDDETARGVQIALRWVLYPNVPDSDVTECLVG